MSVSTKHHTRVGKAPFVTEVLLRRNDVPSFDTYPFALPAIRNLRSLPLHPRVTFLVGENGSGKSTLLEAIAVEWGLNAEGGSRNMQFSTRASHSPLADYLTLVKAPAKARDSYFLRSESYFNVASEIEELDKDPYGGPKIIASYGGVSLHEQSHGESFLALFLNRLQGLGFYVLDEPEAALSPMRMMTVMARMHTLVQEGSQFVIATHSPMLITYPDADILHLSAEGIRKVHYEETDHFFVMREFLNDPARMQRTLFAKPSGSDAS